MLKPICLIGDALATKIPASPFRQLSPETVGEDLNTETLLELLVKIPAKNWLLPQYDKSSIDWIFKFVGQRKAYGDLRSAVVLDKKRKAIGWYIYYAAPGSVGEVLQIGADSNSFGKVLDHLFYDAWEHGLIGLHGRCEPQFLQELTMKSCFLLRTGSWTLVHSNKIELLNLIQSGNAFFSRLDGEWALRPGPEELKGDVEAANP